MLFIYYKSTYNTARLCAMQACLCLPYMAMNRWPVYISTCIPRNSFFVRAKQICPVWISVLMRNDSFIIFFSWKCIRFGKKPGSFSSKCCYMWPVFGVVVPMLNSLNQCIYIIIYVIWNIFFNVLQYVKIKSGYNQTKCIAKTVSTISMIELNVLLLKWPLSSKPIEFVPYTP